MGVGSVVIGAVALLSGIPLAHADDAGTAPAPPAQSQRVAPEASVRLRSELESFADRATRLRLRMRARIGAAYQLEHGLEVGARLSTGSDDPTSSQLTLGGAFDKRPLRLDRAYIRYRPGPWLELWAGKTPIVFEHRRLIWDRDVQPEGLSEIVQHALGATGLSLRLALGQYVLDERADSTRDPAVLVAQIGLAGAHGRARWALHGAHYRYVHVTDSVLDYDHGANSRTPEGVLENDYRILDVLAEATAAVEPVAVTGYAEIAHNTAVDDDGTALAVGADFAIARLRARAGYEYRRVEREAIVDSLAESSWYGQQRTAFQGHKVRVAFELSSELDVATSGKLMRALGAPANRQLEWLVDLRWEL